MERDIFISHASEDRDVADAACLALEQRGFSCWIAPRDLPGEAEPGAAVAAALADARICLLIQSEAANGALQVRRELGEAAQQGLKLAVLQIDEAAPPAAVDAMLGRTRRILALTPPLGVHLDYLGDLVTELGDVPPAPGRQLTLPPQPLPRARRQSWLPIALAGLAGVAAIALAAFYAGPRS